MNLKLCLLSFVFFLFLGVNGQCQENLFKAGAYAANITPPLGLPIVGNFAPQPLAKNVHDELHARILVLNDSKTTLVFVIIDNLLIKRQVLDEAKERIENEMEIPAQNILMSASHTHSGPSANGGTSWNIGTPFDDYQKFLISRIVDGVRAAIFRMEPARIGWGVGSVPQHVFNRRWIMKEPVINPFGELDIAQMNPPRGSKNLLRPAGVTDQQVSFISVQSLERRRPIALLGNYSLHYVGGVPREDISADYFAVFADRIQELLKADRQDPPFVGILSNGTSGDINNVNFLPGTHPPSYAAYEKMRIVANDVAEEVFRVYQSIEHNDWVKLRSAQDELRLKVRRSTSDQLERAKEILSRPDSEKPLYHRLERNYANRTVERGRKDWPAEVDVVLQTFGIGDLGIAAIPFETFAETGLEIKSKSPFATTFTIELANGWYGYLPTPEQHDLGGYETWLGTNNVEKEASVKIVKELMNLFNTIKEINY